MTTKTKAMRISKGERIETTAGVREVLDVRFKLIGAGMKVDITVQDPASPTNATVLRFHQNESVNRVGVTAATLAKRATR